MLHHNLHAPSKSIVQILDSEETCHMAPEVSDFIPGSLEDKDKYIEVADGHHVTAKKRSSMNTNVRQ